MSEVINMPKLGLDMTEGTFINWLKNPGDLIKKGEVIAEVESDKATLEVEAETNGVLIKTLVNAGDTVPVGAPIAEIGAPGDVSAAKPAEVAQPQPAQAAQPAPAAQPAVAPTNGAAQPVVSKPAEVVARPADAEHMPDGVAASPVARNIARDRGIDLTQVQGTGPNGRIQKADVEAFTPPAKVEAAKPAAAAKVAPTGEGLIEEPLSKMRQRIAQRMVDSKGPVPHFYITNEIDMAPALALRKQINEGLPENQKISVNDLVVKAAALTLRKFPNLNSHYYGDKLVHHEHINIGIAVPVESGGLMNVVAHDADITSISRLAERNKEIIAHARAGKVKPEDIEGSTFTVSNLGPYDVESFSAIITPPEAGVLAIASAQQVPIVVNGEIKIGTRMKCTLSVDHRVSDGAEGAQFMLAFKALLENPMRLLL